METFQEVKDLKCELCGGSLKYYTTQYENIILECDKCHMLVYQHELKGDLYAD